MRESSKETRPQDNLASVAGHYYNCHYSDAPTEHSGAVGLGLGFRLCLDGQMDG